jgi:hypothetical protein
MFCECRAGVQAGAVGCISTNLIAVDSHFVQNVTTGGGADSKLGGGGAVFFGGSNAGAGSARLLADEFLLHIQHCAFIGNRIENPHTTDPGFDICIGPMGSYTSLGDHFLNLRAHAISGNAELYYSKFFEAGMNVSEWSDYVDDVQEFVPPNLTVPDTVYTQLVNGTVPFPTVGDVSMPENTP